MLILYNLIRAISKNKKYLKEEGVEIFYDYLKVVTRINDRLLNDSIKTTEGLKDRLVLIYKSIKLIKKIRVGVFVDNMEGYPKGKIKIQENLEKFLMKKCKSKAKQVRVKAQYYETQ